MNRAHYVLALLTLAIAAACGSPTATAAPPTNPLPSGGVVAPVCVSFVIVQQRVADFKALDPSTASAEDYRFAGRQVVGAYRDFQNQAKNALEGKAYLVAAEQALTAAVEQLPPTSTAQDAATALQDEATAFFAALDQAGSELGCPVTTPAP